MPDYHALIGAGFRIGRHDKLGRAGSLATSWSKPATVSAGLLEHYPVAVDIPSLLLSVLFRNRPALVAHLCTRTRAEGLRRTLRRQIRHPVADRL